MNIVDFGKEQSVHIGQHGSNFRMSRLVRTASVQVACMYLKPGELIGYHPATTHQVFAVVEGAGWVRGEGPNRIPLGKGRAAVWVTGEYHEAGTDTGMVAIVIEGDVVGGAPEAIGPPST